MVESCIFYAQIISIIVYIIFCKIFKALKNSRNPGKCLDKNDPFQKILLNKNEDFLENENFFMLT